MPAVGLRCSNSNMDSPEQFYQIIHSHYKNIVADEFPKPLLDGVTKKLALEFHEQYSRFKKQHPKSTKRYSSFQTKDLDHPQTLESIIEFLKTNVNTEYIIYAGELLKMNEAEIIEFEKNRKDFYNMF